MVITIQRAPSCPCRLSRARRHAREVGLWRASGQRAQSSTLWRKHARAAAAMVDPHSTILPPSLTTPAHSLSLHRPHRRPPPSLPATRPFLRPIPNPRFSGSSHRPAGPAQAGRVEKARQRPAPAPGERGARARDRAGQAPSARAGPVPVSAPGPETGPRAVRPLVLGDTAGAIQRNFRRPAIEWSSPPAVPPAAGPRTPRPRETP